MTTLYGYVSNTGAPEYDDIVNSDLPTEEKVKQIQMRGQAYRDELDRDAWKNYARMGLGTLISGASMHPILNIPYIGTGLGGAMYELGQGMVEGDKLPEILKRTGQGFAIGETVGAVPYVGKLAGKTKAGQAVGKQFDKVAQKVAANPTVQKIEDVLMTDVKAFNPNKQIMYHGSPADFNKFDNAYIGTGEGAQAHGMGHYAALDKDVAGGYRKRLSTTTPEENLIKQYGKERVIGDLQKDLNDSLQELQALQKAKIEQTKVKDFGRRKPIDYNNSIKLIEEEINNLQNRIYNINNPQISGQLYKLSVPKDDVMLREGATFAQQPKKVQEAIKSIVKENPELAEVIDTRTADEFFEIAQKKLGKKGKNIMKEVFDAELSGDENKIINAWDKYNEFESKNPNITRTDFDPNKIYGYLKNYRNNGVDETGQLFQNQYSNTNLYKYLEDEKNFNKALYDKGIKGISYNGGIDGEARVIFNPDDIVIGRKYYNQPNLYQQLTGKQNTGALVDALLNR